MGLVESGDVGITGEDETPGVADPLVFAANGKNQESRSTFLHHALDASETQNPS